MKLKVALIMLIVLLILGCSQHSNSSIEINETHVTVVDDFGFKVIVEKYPKRIVSLAPSNTEILFALGLGDRVVGVTDYCNYPPEVVKLKRVGKIQSVGGYSTVNVEKVIRLKPDLVVASYGNGLEVIKTLKEFGIPVICLNPKNLTGIEKDIYLLGVVCGVEDNASKLVNWMEEKIKAVKAKKHNWKPKIVHIVWNDPIWVSGRDTFVDDLITTAGGVNAVKQSGWVVLSLEDLIRLNPDIIIVNSGNGMSAKGRNIIYEWVVSNELLKNVNAVKYGNVYVVDADMICRPSYRAVYVLENISRIIDLAYENATKSVVVVQ